MVNSRGDVKPRLAAEMLGLVAVITGVRRAANAICSARRPEVPSGAQESVEAGGQLLRRRRAAKASAASPVAIRAYVLGSGTVVGARKLMLSTKNVA